MKTQVLTDEGLIQYDELIKKYIDSQSNINEVISTEEPEQEVGEFWLKEYE